MHKPPPQGIAARPSQGDRCRGDKAQSRKGRGHGVRSCLAREEQGPRLVAGAGAEALPGLSAGAVVTCPAWLDRTAIAIILAGAAWAIFLTVV
jgi:hypothetical protein